MNSVTYFTTGDIIEVTKLTPKQVRYYCDMNAVTPIEGGEGQGNHRKFTVQQTLGLAVVKVLQDTERGCVLPYARRVIEAFSNISCKWLQTELEIGHIYFAEVWYDAPVLVIATRSWQARMLPNVKDLYTAVLQRIHTSYTRPRPRLGRKVGSLSSHKVVL